MLSYLLNHAAPADSGGSLTSYSSKPHSGNCAWTGTSKSSQYTYRLMTSLCRAIRSFNCLRCLFRSHRLKILGTFLLPPRGYIVLQTPALRFSVKPNSAPKLAKALVNGVSALCSVLCGYLSGCRFYSNYIPSLKPQLARLSQGVVGPSVGI
jgi:hypothetical protein